MPSWLRPFDLPLLFILLSAAWGMAVAHDPPVADRRFLWIAAGLLLYRGVSRLPVEVEWRGRRVPALSVTVAAISTAVAAWFLLTHDWTRPVDKVLWLNPLQQLLALRPFTPAWPPIHPNVAGGLLACLLPLHVATLWTHATRPVTRGWRWVGWLTVCISAFALLMSRLRGGWLALALSCAVTTWVAACARWDGGTRRWRVLATGLPLAAGSGVAAAVLIVGTPLLRPDRWLIWTNSWGLAWDYPFTGFGLGGFPMAYSSYALLLHVPYTMHAHNLFLDMWMEQGVVGLAALSWVAWLAMTPSARPDLDSTWVQAARLSWMTTLLLGVVDDVHYGYGGVGALLLFVPVAMLARTELTARSVTRTKGLHDGGGSIQAGDWSASPWSPSSRRGAAPCWYPTARRSHRHVRSWASTAGRPGRSRMRCDGQRWRS